MVEKEQNINISSYYNTGLAVSLDKLLGTTTITLRNFDILLMLDISNTRHLYAWSEDFSCPCSVSEWAKVIPNFIDYERKNTPHRKSEKAKESSKLLRSNLQALLIQYVYLPLLLQQQKYFSLSCPCPISFFYSFFLDLH